VRFSQSAASAEGADHKDQEGREAEHQLLLAQLKRMLTETPFFGYLTAKPVTIQCDASEKGLGAVLLRGQPVAFSSRSLQLSRGMLKFEKKKYDRPCTSFISMFMDCRKFM
jgi:hypothetical protein